MKAVHSAIVGLTTVLVSMHAAAQQPPTWKAAAVRQATSPTVPLDIPPQPMEKALQAFAAQSGLQVIFPTELTQAISSPGLKGTYTPENALNKLLANTNLKFEYVNERTVAIRSANASTAESSQAPKTTRTMEDKERPLALAQAAQAQPQSRPAQTPRQESASDSRRASNDNGEPVPEILVTGSRSLNMDIRRTRDDVQPYVVFDREKIAESGATSLEEFFKNRLTMNTQGTSNNQTGIGTLSQINLRGLGTNQTLILVDGHRASGVSVFGTPNQADINGIPLASVERIEVLPTSASGIYGGGATGGVVNIILRRDYTGAELKLTYDNTFDTDSARRRMDLSAGFNLEEGATNILLAASYSDANPFLARDRDFIQRARAAILVNNAGAVLPLSAPFPNPPLGATTNIRSANGSPLFGPGTSNFTSVPVGYAGGGGVAPLQSSAGSYNLDLADSAQNGSSGGQALLNAPTVKSLTATMRRQFGSRFHAFMEAARSDTDGHFPASAAATSFQIQASAPNNPFGQAIQVTVPSGSADTHILVDTENTRIVGGVIVKLPGQWQGEVDYTWNRSSWSLTQGPGLSAAGVSAIRDGTLDVLRDTQAFPLDYSPFLNPPTGTLTPFQSTLKDATLRVAGPVWALPGGPLTLSGMLEYRDESFAQGLQFVSATTTAVRPGRSQSVRSIYLEARAPLVSPRNSLPGIQELELQVAGRADEYTTDGATDFILDPATPVTRSRNETRSANPTLGLRYQPVRDLMVRASYGTGFLPPAVNQLIRTPAAGSGIVAVDPVRGNEQVALSASQILVGGNPDLQPEESESWSLGVVLKPRLLPGLRLSVDYTRIDKEDNIFTFAGNAQGAQSLINNEADFPDRITRGTPDGHPSGAGPITAIDLSAVNISRAQVEAFDAALDYGLDTARLGAFEFFALATWQTHYKTQALPSSPFEENAGVTAAFPLRFKANAGLSWKYRRWTLGWVTRYFDDYQVSTSPLLVLNQGDGGRVADQVYHDVFGSYRIEALGNELVKSLEIQAGLKNVFDAKPPFDANFSPNFYSPFGDPRLASYYLSLITAF